MDPPTDLEEHRVHVERITLAATNLAATVGFYNAVFSSNLKQMGTLPIYLGSLLGMELLVCDNSLAMVEAKQNRHQFRIAVSDLGAIRGTIEAAGGAVINEGQESGRAVIGVRDPDGNTYEFIEG